MHLIAKYLLPLPVLPLIATVLLLCGLQASTLSMRDACHMTIMCRCSNGLRQVLRKQECSLWKKNIKCTDLYAPGLQILLSERQILVPLACCVLICPAAA